MTTLGTQLPDNLQALAIGQSSAMSGPYICYMIYQLLLPFGDSMRTHRICLLLPILALTVLSACNGSTSTKASLDAEVRRLCELDGGVIVYETVKLPADKFNERGQIDFWIPSKEMAESNDQYYYERTIQYIRKGNPELSRSKHSVFRKKDGKLLGVSVRYARGGGDVPGPWHDSTFICPEPNTSPELEASIFINSQGK